MGQRLYKSTHENGEHPLAGVQSSAVYGHYKQYPYILFTHTHTWRRGMTSNRFSRALLKKLQLLCWGNIPICFLSLQNRAPSLLCNISIRLVLQPPAEGSSTCLLKVTRPIIVAYSTGLHQVRGHLLPLTCCMTHCESALLMKCGRGADTEESVSTWGG